MSLFDALIRADTLIFSQALGPNRQIIVEEVKIQHVNPYRQPGKSKEAIGTHRLLRALQQGRRQEPQK